MKRVRAVLTGLGALAAALVGAAPAADAQLAAYTGRFAGGAEADGIVLELYEVEGGALAGQLDAGDDGRFLVSGHPSNAGVQGIISGEADHAFFHIERSDRGLRFVFVPAAEDGQPSYDTARVLKLTRTAPGLAFTPPVAEPAAVSQSAVPLRAPEETPAVSIPETQPAPAPVQSKPDLASPPVDPATSVAAPRTLPVPAEKRAPVAKAVPYPRPRPGTEVALTHPPVAIPPAEDPEIQAEANQPPQAADGFDPVAMARELGVDAIGFGGAAGTVEAEEPQDAQSADDDSDAEDLPGSRDPLLRRQRD